MASLPIERIYENTVKFSCNNEHNEQQVLQMLTNRGDKNKIWGINVANRGKIVEIKYKNKNDGIKIIQTGIYDNEFEETYIVEPALDTSRTTITSFNVPLGASGSSIQQFLEEKHFKVTSHERQNIRYGDSAVYTGVIKFRCEKLNGFQNLPNYKIFYNNRRIGLRHAEQYEERQRIEEENRLQEEKERERRKEEREIEQRNRERNRIRKEERMAKEEEERDKKKKKEEKRKEDRRELNRFKDAINHLPETNSMTTETEKSPRVTPKQFMETKEGYIYEDEGMEGI